MIWTNRDLVRITREIIYAGLNCSLSLQQFEGGVLLMRISGTDTGEFSDAPVREAHA